MFYPRRMSKAAFLKLQILFILIEILKRFGIVQTVRCSDKISMHECHLISFRMHISLKFPSADTTAGRAAAPAAAAAAAF